MRNEMQRRQNATDRVEAILRSAPCRWIHWRRFEQITACSWRTRISECRKRFEREGGTLENNHSITRSAYRYLPHTPLGRDAATEQSGQRTLFGGSFQR